jgi:hypothetical protein
MSQSAAARMTRNKMRADWDTVHAMLTDPKAPRRDAQGRHVFEVWADMVLANPAAEYARVARDILPAETPDNSDNNTVVNRQRHEPDFRQAHTWTVMQAGEIKRDGDRLILRRRPWECVLSAGFR